VILFQELFKILAEDGLSASEKEHIWASIRNRSIPREEKTHEALEDFPKETEKLWIMIDEENPLEADAKEHPFDLVCTSGDKQRNLEDFHDDQEYMDPTESWFHMTLSIYSSFIIRQSVASHQLV